MNVWKKRIGISVRKAAAMLCLVCMLFLFCIVQVNGAGTAAITVSSCSVELGDTATVTVRLDGNPGLWGLKLRIGYDSSALTLEVVNTGSLFSEGELTCSESLQNNPYVIVASRGNLEDLTADGVIVTLKFSVNAGAARKTYPVTVEIAQALNVAGENVSIGAASGSVTVVDCLHAEKHWITTEAPACEKSGTEALTCKKCAAVFETRSLSATDHQHTEVRGAAAATQTRTGYTGDTYCTDCGKLLRQGTIIEKLPADTQPPETQPPETQPPVTPPQITSGDLAVFHKDSDAPLVFVSDADFQDFIRVEVDGVTLHADHYTVASGSTIVTVRQDYLKTLDAGVHSLSIVSKTGTATASFTIEEAVTQPEETKAPETVAPSTEAPVPEETVPETVPTDEAGTPDGSSMILIVALVVGILCVAGVAVVIVMVKRRG